MGQMIVIDDSTPVPSHIGPDGQMRATGLIKKTHAAGTMAIAPLYDLPIFPESTWPAMIQAILGSTIRDIMATAGPNGGPVPPLDQDGYGYCWGHSTGSCMLADRAIQGLPYVALSPFAACCIIKNYRDQGGNGIDSLQFAADRGYPSDQFWPMQSTSRANDNPATWANAAQHKALVWRECSDDPTQRRLQVGSALLMRRPVIGDFDWWGHSVMVGVLLSPDSTLILNSWGQWSDGGWGILTGRKAWPDAAWVLCTETASQT